MQTPDSNKLTFDGQFVEPVNGVVIIENGKAFLKAVCPCGQSEFSLEVASSKTEIFGKIGENVAEKENNPHGGGAFEISTTKIERFDCRRCGRELVVSAKFTLTPDEWASVQKRWSEGAITKLHKGLVQIESRVSHGYFSGFDNNAFIARCQSCYQKVWLSESIQYFNELCSNNAVDLLEFDSAILPRTITQSIKCPACLQYLESTVTTSVEKPATAHELVEVWQLWNPSSGGVGQVSAPEPQGGQTGLITKKG